MTSIVLHPRKLFQVLQVSIGKSMEPKKIERGITLSMEFPLKKNSKNTFELSVFSRRLCGLNCCFTLLPLLGFLVAGRCLAKKNDWS